MGSIDSPAYRLSGRDLPEGWKVLDYSFPSDEFSRGHNSVCYLAKSTSGKVAFLKAIDYQEALKYDGVPDKLYNISKAYRYERDLMKLCRDVGLSNVPRLIDDGGINLEHNNLASHVDYLIIERADYDIRPYVGDRENSRISRILSMMHQTIVATQQLHSIRIAHQDIKPANLLVHGGEIIKLGDLGRATQFSNPSPYDNEVFPGDPNYAPPEFLYRNPQGPSRNWMVRRFGCDFYMLGSVLLFMSTGFSMNQILLDKLDKNYWPEHWSGTYDDVYPFLQYSFVQCLDEIKRATHDAVADDITDVVKQLCHLRPEKRGLPLNQGFNQYSLHKFVSRLNFLYTANQFAPWHNEPICEQVM